MHRTIDTWVDDFGVERRVPSRNWKLKSNNPAHKALRDFILRRDKVCLHCGTTHSPNLDHIVSIRMGGSHDPSNLQRLCTSCNSRKSVYVEGAGGYKHE